MGVLSDAFGYCLILWTVVAQNFTGHISISVRCCVTVSMRSPFFWFSNVMDTVSADKSVLRDRRCLRTFRPRRKVMFPTVIFFVLLVSGFPGTLRYSQDLMPKNNAPHTSVATALSSSVVLRLRRQRNTASGNAGWRSTGESVFVKLVSSRAIVKCLLPMASSAGSARPCVRKVCATLVIVFLTVSPRRAVLDVRPK